MRSQNGREVIALDSNKKKNGFTGIIWVYRHHSECLYFHFGPHPDVFIAYSCFYVQRSFLEVVSGIKLGLGLEESKSSVLPLSTNFPALVLFGKSPWHNSRLNFSQDCLHKEHILWNLAQLACGFFFLNKVSRKYMKVDISMDAGARMYGLQPCPFLQDSEETSFTSFWLNRLICKTGLTIAPTLSISPYK